MIDENQHHSSPYSWKHGVQTHRYVLMIDGYSSGLQYAGVILNELWSRAKKEAFLQCPTMVMDRVETKASSQLEVAKSTRMTIGIS